MKLASVWLLFASAVLAVACGSETSESTANLTPTPGLVRAEIDPGAPVGALSAGFNNAGFDLLRTQPSDGNIVFSPASIGHAVLMAEGAADDATARAIASAFGLPDQAHDAWNSIDQQISAGERDDVTVAIADRIWPRIEVEPDQGWVDLLAAKHGADLVALDYEGDSEGSRDIINEWVSDATEGLIPELLPVGIPGANTTLVLTDAIYFAADWAVPFGKYGEVDAPFTKLDGSEVNTTFMRELELSDRRGRGDGFVGAEIPYANTEFSMLVLVPDEGTFEQFRDGLGQDLLDEIDASFTQGPFELLLPRWEDTSAIDLLPWLESLDIAPGLYPGITPDSFLDAAVHGADIAVDETGTVAAAATALAFNESGPPEPELTVAADQPFVYLIRHQPTGLVLFAGQVVDPN